VALAMDRYPIDYSESLILYYINDILAYCFLMEMIIHLLGLGINDYF